MSRHTPRAIAIVDACQCTRVAQKELIKGVERALQALEDEVLGKAPMTVLKGKLPVVLYFNNDQDREAFIQMAQAAHLNLKPHKLPPAT
jgi:hypothetical protein